MNVLGLFSGIGGFELGFQRAGFNIAAMCEIEPYARAVLQKHWPGVPVFDDVRAVNADMLDILGLSIDVVTGGFPCQDISFAGRGAGLAGERSGLWWELHRVIEEVKPAYAVVENVSALRSRGLDVVLGSLAAIGYDAEWHCVPASAVGAPHRRDRIWIVAYPHGEGKHDGALDAEVGGAPEPVADAQQQRLEGRPRLARHLADELAALERGGAVLADTGCDGLERTIAARGSPVGWRRRSALEGCAGDWWLVEPDVGRVADGVPARVDRLRALGNAVVPQIPEALARAIKRVASTA